MNNTYKTLVVQLPDSHPCVSELRSCLIKMGRPEMAAEVRLTNLDAVGYRPVDEERADWYASKVVSKLLQEFGVLPAETRQPRIGQLLETGGVWREGLDTGTY
jgi:hypothetical protein